MAQYTATPATQVLGASTHSNVVYAGYTKNSGTIVDAAVATDSLSTLVAAVKAADLVDTLASPGPFTVFAPANGAFNALPEGKVAKLLKPKNKAKLQGILKAHVVSGNLSAADIIGLAKQNGGSVDVQTVSGDTLTAILSGDTLYVRDEISSPFENGLTDSASVSKPKRYFFWVMRKMFFAIMRQMGSKIRMPAIIAAPQIQCAFVT